MKVRTFIPAILAAAVLLSSGLILAQTNTMPPGQHAWHGMSSAERMDRLAQELNLTDEQKTNVQSAFDQMRQTMQEARTNLDNQLQGIMTPEQYQKFESMREQHMHHMGPPPSNGTNSQSGN
jgi:Spy/CpxP family protein refolding chaperone